MAGCDEEGKTTGKLNKCVGWICQFCVWTCGTPQHYIIYFYILSVGVLLIGVYIYILVLIPPSPALLPQVFHNRVRVARVY